MFKVKKQLSTLILGGIEYISQEVANKIKDKSLTHNIFRIQANDSFMHEFFCITFIEYTIARKSLLSYTNFFP